MVSDVAEPQMSLPQTISSSNPGSSRPFGQAVRGSGVPGLQEIIPPVEVDLSSSKSLIWRALRPLAREYPEHSKASGVTSPKGKWQATIPGQCHPQFLHLSQNHPWATRPKGFSTWTGG